MSLLRPQFRLSALLLVIFAIAATLSLWPMPPTEVAAGFHSFMLPSGQRALCGIDVVTRSPVAVESALRNKADQLRREVVIACRGLSPQELQDPALSELKRELLTRINHLVGPARVDYLIIHQFELRNTD